MPRRYREKKYYCGEYLEVAIYPVYTHPKKRGKGRKPTTEIQQRLNQRHTEWRRFLQFSLFRAIIPLTTITAGKYYDENSFSLSRQDLSQVTDAKLHNAMPPFATGFPHLYYSLTTLQNNHILPPT